MGFDLATGIVLIVGIAFVVLAFLLIGRKTVKAPAPDEGVNASSELHPHEPGHVGRNEPSDAENRPSAV